MKEIVINLFDSNSIDEDGMFVTIVKDKGSGHIKAYILTKEPKGYYWNSFQKMGYCFGGKVETKKEAFELFSKADKISEYAIYHFKDFFEFSSFVVSLKPDKIYHSRKLIL